AGIDVRDKVVIMFRREPQETDDKATFNGRRLSGSVSWEQLKQIIEFEIEYQKTAKNAGENCGCELKLPSPLN
ncbi:MAG: hypothetical protein ACK6D7_10205, partial [Acidobacteriota bacterium]